MPSHVLCLSQVVGFEPVCYGALPDLFGVGNGWIYLFYIPEQVPQAVFNILAAVDADKQLVFKLCFINLIRLPAWFRFGDFFNNSCPDFG